MVWHYDRDIQFVFAAMVSAAGRKGDIASQGRQLPPELRDECDEMRFIVPLQMRKMASVGLHPRILTPSYATHQRNVEGLCKHSHFRNRVASASQKPNASTPTPRTNASGATWSGIFLSPWLIFGKNCDYLRNTSAGSGLQSANR